MIAAFLVAMSLQVGQGAYIVSARPPLADRQVVAQTTNAGTRDPNSTQPVCRMEPVTGTRFPVRVCRSPRTARLERNETQDLLRNGQGLPDLPPELRGHRKPGI